MRALLPLLLAGLVALETVQRVPATDGLALVLAGEMTSRGRPRVWPGLADHDAYVDGYCDAVAPVPCTGEPVPFVSLPQALPLVRPLAAGGAWAGTVALRLLVALGLVAAARAVEAR